MAAFKWILIVFGYILLVAADQTLIEKCGQNNWCEDCITARKECAWCNDETFTDSRCSTFTDLTAKSCKDIYHPDNFNISKKNEPLRDGTETVDPIQLQPQHMTVRLRLGKPQTLSMTYKIARNLPLDLYFVLDFSTTMKTRLESLADLTNNLIGGLKEKFTSNIYIGFGSFLDKRAQPFHITTAAYMKNPCVINGEVCAPSYGFIHRRKLNSDIDGFIKTIRSSNTSGNFDPMEGGLDAMLQVAVCPDIIGWRSQSRRVLIYISDNGFHFAGDGKLAGIDKPNDGECHLESHGDMGESYIYTEELTQDYPSLGQIAEVLENNKINTFFVVDAAGRLISNDDLYSGGDLSMYTDFAKMIKQAETATMNDRGAVGIIDSITDFYTRLSKTVKISAEHIPKEIEVSLASDCGGNQHTKQTKDLKEEDLVCEDLRIGQRVDFDITLLATTCPKNSSDVHSFTIHPAGLQESLTIDVSYICDCNCPQNDTKDAEMCSQGNGTYECGVCRCKKGRSGEICQCSGDDESDSAVDESSCKRFNTSDVKCSNKGICKCGQCSCNPFQTGKYCECDSSKCIAADQEEKCGGALRGECNCDTCECKEGFAGDYCECFSDIRCLGPNGRICSGNGRCECGECECKADYYGDTCENCPRCDRCQKCAYKECVKCLDESTDKSGNSTCLDKCKNVTIRYVKRFNDSSPCGFFDKKDCQVPYMVQCDNITETLLIANRKQCTNPPNALLIVLPILAGIIGVGLFLLIIWKILTSFYDKIEYARFEHEVKNPKWNQQSNPIYDPPVTTNMNPTYKGTVD